jgi:hypothetical protein
MSHAVYLAYGEGQFASTANGIFIGLAVLFIGCVVFGIYSYQTYPSDKN